MLGRRDVRNSNGLLAARVSLALWIKLAEFQQISDSKLSVIRTAKIVALPIFLDCLKKLRPTLQFMDHRTTIT
jgi:hypothetical protein